jgi:hypothetical protein
MISDLRRSLLSLSWTSLFAAFMLSVFPACAELISTEAVLQAQSARDHVKEVVERPEVRKKLESLGVSAQDAQDRVDSMSDEELRALAARINALPAGGTLTKEELLIIIIVVLLVALIA